MNMMGLYLPFLKRASQDRLQQPRAVNSYPLSLADLELPVTPSARVGAAMEEVHNLAELKSTSGGDVVKEPSNSEGPRRRFRVPWHRAKKADEELESVVAQGVGIRYHTAAVITALYASTLNWRMKSFLFLGSIAGAIARGSDEFMGLLHSCPRTFRTLSWACQAGYSYKKLMMAHTDKNTDEYAKALSHLHSYWASRCLELCRANGGIYVKCGQFAANFGALPMEYRIHLQLLQDKATPRPFSVVDRVLMQELGAGADVVFAEFDQQATAAASLAQVHRARLHNGKEVAVKVQYPGLQSAATADLTTLKFLNNITKLMFPEFNLWWLYSELKIKLEEELDFHTETNNSLRLTRCLSSNKAIAVPRVFNEFCTSKIITMEWISGCKVTDTNVLKELKISPHQVGVELEKAFGQMTFLHGYIHADPHAGNIMVRPRGRAGLLSWLFRGSWQPFEVVLLDHGGYLELDHELRQQYCELWCALCVQDKETAGEVATLMGGDRAGHMLPVLLTSGAKSEEDRKRLQKNAGVKNLGDISQLLAYAPRPLVEVLRITSVVRNVTGHLGINLPERVRINAGFAAQGLPPRNKAVSHEAEKKFQKLSYRMQIRIRLGLINGIYLAHCAINRSLMAAFYVFGQPIVIL